MNGEMKVFLSEGYGKGSIVNMPIPELTNNTVLVKVCYCGICGTDQDLFSSECSFAQNGQVTYPVRLGHEWSGIVEAVGKDVTEFKKGDKVVGDNAITCGTCPACMKGEYSNCHHMLNVGTIDPVYDGAFSEYYRIPAHHLYKVPEGISLKAASGGIKRMQITQDSVVVVIGTGCIGMSAAVLAKCLGAKKVIVLGKNAEKLKVTKSLGVDVINVRECDAVQKIKELTDGKGADYVLECSGAKGTYKQAIDMTAFRGTIALIGFYENRENEVNIDAIVSKALNMFGVMGEMGNMSGALKILKEHKPDLLPIITDELPFDDCIRGFTRKNYPNAVKIAVKICEE